MTKPDKEDFDLVEKQHGPLPANATDQQVVERYRLSQAAKLIRESGANNQAKT
ncbi:MAG: hypothetical protein WCF47_12680 [Pseudolabrys sp.]